MKKLLLYTCLFIFIATAASAEVFVNWAAEYYVEYPDDWFLVPYKTVNIFLISQNINPEEFQFEGVIARKTDKPFFEEPYIFMISDQIGKLTPMQIDSLKSSVAAEYNYRCKDAIITNNKAIFGLNQPVYDSLKNIIVVKSRVISEFTDKYMLEIRKIYENGIAYFFCYAHKDLYNEMQPIFLDIVSTFSTENLDEVAPAERSKIINVADRRVESNDAGEVPEGSETDSGNSIIYILVIIGVLAVVIVAVVMFLKR